MIPSLIPYNHRDAVLLSAHAGAPPGKQKQTDSIHEREDTSLLLVKKWGHPTSKLFISTFNLVASESCLFSQIYHHPFGGIDLVYISDAYTKTH